MVVWDLTGSVGCCQNFVPKSNVYRKNNFPTVCYPLDFMVSIVPAKKNLFHCKEHPLFLFFMLRFWGRVKAFTPGSFSATCVWREHQQNRQPKKT